MPSERTGALVQGPEDRRWGAELRSRCSAHLQPAVSRFCRRSGEGAAPGRAPHHWPGCRPSCPRTPLSMRPAAPTALLAAPSGATGGNCSWGAGLDGIRRSRGCGARGAGGLCGRTAGGCQDGARKMGPRGLPAKGKWGRRSPEGSAEGAVSRGGQQRGDARPEAFRRPTTGRARVRKVLNAERGASCKPWAARRSPHYRGRRKPVRGPQGPGGEGGPGSPSVLPCEGQRRGETRVLLR